MIEIKPNKTRVRFKSFSSEGIAEVVYYLPRVQERPNLGTKQVLLIKNGIFRPIKPYKLLFEKLFNLDDKLRSSMGPTIYNIDSEESIDLPNCIFEYIEEEVNSTPEERFIRRAILSSVGNNFDV